MSRRNSMSDDEFSDFSDEEKSPKIIPINQTNEEQFLTIASEPLPSNIEIVEAVETKEMEMESPQLPIHESNDNDYMPKFPLDWNEYKKIENDVLKFILLFCWVEEKIVIRGSLKHLQYKETFEFKTNVYDIKNYQEKTDDFVPKLSLVYAIFNFLEKCPYEECLDSKSLKYVSKMFKKEPRQLLEYFKTKISSESTLEKCLAFYSSIFLLPPSERTAELFVNLENLKRKLEILLV